MNYRSERSDERDFKLQRWAMARWSCAERRPGRRFPIEKRRKYSTGSLMPVSTSSIPHSYGYSKELIGRFIAPFQKWIAQVRAVSSCAL